MVAPLGFAGLVLALGLTPMAPADATGIGELPQPLRQTARCMLHVMKRVPGVAAPRWRVTNDGHKPPQPLLEYTYSYKDGRSQPVQFYAEASGDAGGAYTFIAGLRGFSGRFAACPPGRTPNWRGQCSLPPPDWGTDRLSALWKKRCHVDSGAIYE
jgi:hypothetical protein